MLWCAIVLLWSMLWTHYTKLWSNRKQDEITHSFDCRSRHDLVYTDWNGVSEWPSWRVVFTLVHLPALKNRQHGRMSFGARVKIPSSPALNQRCVCECVSVCACAVCSSLSPSTLTICVVFTYAIAIAHCIGRVYCIGILYFVCRCWLVYSLLQFAVLCTMHRWRWRQRKEAIITTSALSTSATGTQSLCQCNNFFFHSLLYSAFPFFSAHYLFTLFNRIAHWLLLLLLLLLCRTILYPFGEEGIVDTRQQHTCASRIGRTSSHRLHRHRDV